MTVGARRKTSRRTQPAPPPMQPPTAAAFGAPTTKDNTVTMTVNPVRSDDTLDDWWDSHLRAMDRAKLAADQAVPLEDKTRQRVEAAEQLRQQANALRAQAAEADRQADEKFADAEAAAQQAQQHRAAEHRARDTASDHADRLAEQVARGREHPAERFQQAAASFDASPLDAPLPPPLVGSGMAVGDTQSFPAQPDSAS